MILARGVAVRPQADAHTFVVQFQNVVVELHVPLVDVVQKLQIVRRQGRGLRFAALDPIFWYRLMERGEIRLVGIATCA